MNELRSTGSTRGAREVDAALERFLPAAPAVRPRVREAMHYSLLAGGKRLRPTLALAAAEAVALANGADVERRPRAGAAGRLRARAHPHLLPGPRRPPGHGRRHAAAGPADQPRRVRRGAGDPRRRRPADRGLRADGARAGATAHRSSPRASCARSGSSPTPPAPCGMVGGQAIDLEAAGRGARLRRPTDSARMHARKTGALIRASAAAGAVMAGAGDGAARGDRALRRASSAWPSRSSTTSSTSKGRRKRSGRPPARTPPRASRPIPRSTASTRRAGWRPSASTARSTALAGPARPAGGQLPAIARWVVGDQLAGS